MNESKDQIMNFLSVGIKEVEIRCVLRGMGSFHLHVYFSFFHFELQKNLRPFVTKTLLPMKIKIQSFLNSYVRIGSFNPETVIPRQNNERFFTHIGILFLKVSV